mmetsp:Transcript_4364/g.7676  ORF Transcript_4364/g.7676 Transcript_4364/m.7676 type:complete len:545 (-) Transcript_4364:2749-4383(-)
MSTSKALENEELMPEPQVDEKEEILDESKMEAVRMAMKHDIKDDLDNTSSSSTNPGPGSSKIDVATVLSSHHINILHDLEERSKYIPMRLSSRERDLLGILEGALDISEYTDNVDVSSNNYFARQAIGKEDTIVDEINKLGQAIAGLSVCGDYRSFGAKILCKNLQENEELFQECMEIGRRYKIMNPDKMRASYGKLLYVIMDSVNPRVKRTLDYELKRPLQTVHRTLLELDALALLQDPLLAIAASEIDVGDQAMVARAQSQKANALQELVSKYITDDFTEETLRLVVASISDNISFLRSNRGPVDKMIHYLKAMFNPNVEPQNKLESLRIIHGKDGSKLSHSHETQFYFVLQSLTLWREIMGNFFKLWVLSENDLLDERNGYRLCNTGQGLQRCQNAPRVSTAMSQILGEVKRKVGRWIGLSVVHLGDRDVPNALMFIDKYIQVPQILAPIVSTVEKIDDIVCDKAIADFVEQKFGSTKALQKQILASYFRNGFDGSGDDGGSCIDGRITSSWEWTSKIEKKPFYCIFMLTGFTGFNGDYKA